jgi:hypothetical protein
LPLPSFNTSRSEWQRVMMCRVPDFPDGTIQRRSI